jgi:hypothetical protein
MNKFSQNIFNEFNLKLFFIIFLINIIIPLNLSHSSSASYDFNLILSLLIIFFIIFFFFFFLLSFFSLVAKKFHIYKIWVSLISFFLFWIFITGIFFPITGNPDPFFNLSLSINKKFEVIIKTLLIIFFFLIIKKRDKKNYFFRFVYIFIIFNFIFIIFNIQNNTSNKNDHKLNYLGNKNLIVLSFDGISGYKLNEEIINNFELKNILKDFKFYKNTISGAPYTWPSMNIELNGKFEDINSQGYYRNILNQEEIDVVTYNYYNFIHDKSKIIPQGKYEKYNANFKINKFIQEYFIGSVGRWASPIGVFVVENLPYKNSYKFFLNLIFKNKPDDLNPFQKVNTISNIDLFEFDIIFENLKKDNTLNNVVRMYHFGFSHWPVKLNENCEEIKSLDNEFKSYDHEKILLKCVSKKIIKFIKNLKKQNVYDNSMIIIKSDHAKPNYVERNYSQKFSQIFKKTFNKYYKEYPLNQKINNSFYWGYGRYKPFILIKDQNKIKNNIEISNTQVFLHDLSKTYCEYFSKKNRCGYIKRNNLNLSETFFKNYNYDIYLPIHRFTGTEFYNLKKYEISRNTSFYNFFKINKITLSD